MCELFALQSFVKLILQEGQNFVLLQWATYYNQAVYGFVDNLGNFLGPDILGTVNHFLTMIRADFFFFLRLL